MWDREKAEIIPYFAAKFGQFVTNKMMRNIIWQVKSSFDIMDIMQNKKILCYIMWLLKDHNKIPSKISIQTISPISYYF